MSPQLSIGPFIHNLCKALHMQSMDSIVALPFTESAVSHTYIHVSHHVMKDIACLQYQVYMLIILQLLTDLVVDILIAVSPYIYR